VVILPWETPFGMNLAGEFFNNHNLPLCSPSFPQQGGLSSFHSHSSVLVTAAKKENLNLPLEHAGQTKTT